MRSYRGEINMRFYAEDDEKAREILEYFGTLIEGQSEQITVWVPETDYMDYRNPYFSNEPLADVPQWQRDGT